MNPGLGLPGLKPWLCYLLTLGKSFSFILSSNGVNDTTYCLGLLQGLNEVIQEKVLQSTR